jgi:nitrite reductase/ring-hydroxylating ferredoxin subunit/uncharacterized membrane protein
MPDYIESLSRFFNRQTWLDPAAESVQKAVNQVFQSGGKVGTLIADLLNGTWLGHPLHPVVTDVPVGAWTAAITLDAVEASTGQRGIGKAADIAVIIGVAGAAGSAISGIADWQHTVGESRRVGFIHGTLNTLSLGLFVASLIARSGRNRGLGQALALAGFTVVSASAYLGGDLVYRQKIGVDHAPEDADIDTKDAFVPILAADQLPEGKLTIARLNNIPLVLLRQGGDVYALAETCAHLGGPLADGKVVTGPEGQPVVVCPWHGSHFDMDNGSVLQGPSAYPQPCFEARIREGQVEVRHRVEG